MSTVSVIIPAYNQGHYLSEAIQSVLDQTYQDFEIIIVDDGSTDDTSEVAKSFDDPRVRSIYQENSGLSAARNTGIRHSTGAYLTYLDSDDLFLPEKLDLLVAALKNNLEIGFVAGQAIPIDENGQWISKVFDTAPPTKGSQLLLGNPLHVGSVLVRREWQERVGFFDEDLRSYEDWHMWLRLALAGCKMGWVAKPVSLYRFHSAQMTRDVRQMTTASLATLDKLYSNPDLPEKWRKMRNKAYSAAYLRAAAQAYGASAFEVAKADLTEAVRLDPDLVTNNGWTLVNRFSAWTDHPTISNPLNYLEKVYANLPDCLAELRRRRRIDLGRAAMRLAFETYAQGDLNRCRVAVRQAFRYWPGWLKNRGALSIFVHSHLKLF
jgi:glycosyltransferase involved in cell wall biosynthesis